MNGLAQFTTADGRKIGLPTLSGLLVMGVVISPLENQPKGARTLVRYMLAGEDGVRIAWLRDPYRHVVSKLPLSFIGPWAHMTEKDGNELAFPQNCICAFEQQDDGKFDVTLQIPPSPLTVTLKAVFEEIEETAGFVPSQLTAPPVEEDAGPPEQDRAKTRKRKPAGAVQRAPETQSEG